MDVWFLQNAGTRSEKHRCATDDPDQPDPRSPESSRLFLPAFGQHLRESPYAETKREYVKDVIDSPPTGHGCESMMKVRAIVSSSSQMQTCRSQNATVDRCVRYRQLAPPHRQEIAAIRGKTHSIEIRWR